MDLIRLCKNISCNHPNQLNESHPIASQIMCPEYSLLVQSVKAYPLPKKEQLFALCWCLDLRKRLHATILPSNVPFSYSCSYTPGDRTQLHTHEYIELAYIVDGKFKQRIMGKNIVFNEGEFCLIDKNCLHQDYLEEQNAIVLFFGIGNEIFEEIMGEHIAAEKIIAFLQSALLKQKNLQQYLHFKPQYDVSEEMQQYLYHILEELLCHDNASSYICRGLLMRVFKLLSVGYEFSLSKELKKEMNWILFESVTDYMKEHFADITIKDLVEKFHFQEDYFNRLIKSKTDRTYSAYLQELRLTEAKRLLITSKFSIDRIAESIGYKNKGYFYKIFVKRYGRTPAEIRKLSQAER